MAPSADERAFGIAASLRGEVAVEAGLGDSTIQEEVAAGAWRLRALNPSFHEDMCIIDYLILGSCG